MKLTLKELHDALSSITGFDKKVAYRAFPVGKAPALPFICYMATETNNFDADDKVYHVIQNVDVELYTAKKAEATEALIESKFGELNIVWDKYEEWIDSQEFYQITYSITL